MRTADGRVTTFDLPGAEDTIPNSINRKAQVVGNYYPSERKERGFLRKSTGEMLSLGVPGNKLVGATAINDNRQIVGAYAASYHDYLPGGFLRDPDGSLTLFAVDGARGTSPLAMNNLGEVAGYAYFADTSEVGFTRVTDGQITTFQVSNMNTVVYGINDAGWVTGVAYADGTTNGFIRAPDGDVTTFSAPGSSWTEARAINVAGVVAGDYVDAGGHSHAFIRAIDESLATLDVPGETDTLALAINAHGEVTGFAHAENTAVSFIYHP